jgi:hypothetical protein
MCIECRLDLGRGGGGKRAESPGRFAGRPMGYHNVARQDLSPGKCSQGCTAPVAWLGQVCPPLFDLHPMMKQVRAPSMEHGEKANLGAQVLGISGDGEQGLRRGPEQDAIELSLILVGDGGNLLG